MSISDLLDDKDEQIHRLEAERDNWMEFAAQQAKNTEYYVSLLDEIAMNFGEDSYIADDGTIADSPLRAKMPELVANLKKQFNDAQLKWVLDEFQLIGKIKTLAKENEDIKKTWQYNACQKCESEFEEVISELKSSNNEKPQIPIDLDGCIEFLRERLLNEDISAFMNETEDNVFMFHHSLGRWMRNDWGLWSDSELSKWFNSKGIHHQDDMSGIILTSLWRSLHNQPIRLNDQIEFYKDYWKKVETEKTTYMNMGDVQLKIERYD